VAESEVKCKEFIEAKVISSEMQFVNHMKEMKDEITKTVDQNRMDSITATDKQIDVKMHLSKHETQAKLDELENSIQTIGMNNLQTKLDELEANIKVMQQSLDGYKASMQYLEEIVRPQEGEMVKDEFKKLHAALSDVASGAACPGRVTMGLDQINQDIAALKAAMPNMDMIKAFENLNREFSFVKAGLQVEKGIFHSSVFDQHVVHVDAMEVRIGEQIQEIINKVQAQEAPAPMMAGLCAVPSGKFFG
jgi:chromosome segregation ATPase